MTTRRTITTTASASTPSHNPALTLRKCIPDAVLDAPVEGLSYHILVGAAIHAGLCESFTRQKPRRDECIELLHAAFDGGAVPAAHVINEGHRRGGENSRRGSATVAPSSASPDGVTLDIGGVEITIRPATTNP